MTLGYVAGIAMTQLDLPLWGSIGLVPVAAYDGVQIARIEGVPYRGIGFVFELDGDVEAHPAREGSTEGERMDHLAVFWGNLSR
jgi:hypothetical protein